MLEAKNLNDVNLVFLSVAAFLDLYTRQVENCAVTTIHVDYADPQIQATVPANRNGEALSLRNTIMHFRAAAVVVYRAHCTYPLVTVKFHAPDHLAEDVELFSLLDLLHASPFEYFNVHIKRACPNGSRRRGTQTTETVYCMPFSPRLFGQQAKASAATVMCRTIAPCRVAPGIFPGRFYHFTGNRDRCRAWIPRRDCEYTICRFSLSVFETISLQFL